MTDQVPSTTSIKDIYLLKKSFSRTKPSHQSQKLSIAIYRRVSTQEQATDGQSIEAQKDRIQRFIEFDSTFENIDYKIIDYCDNGYSGKDLERPAVIRLLQDVNEKKVHFIIVVKLDRLSRHLPDMYYLLELFNKYDIGFISINEKIDTKTAHGRFFIGILSSLSQLEREQTSERVQSVFKELVHKQPLGGKAPFGYFYFQPEKKYYPYDESHARRVNLPPLKVLNEDEFIYPAHYIPLMYSWYKNTTNYRKISLRLTELRIPTANTIHVAVKKFFNLSEEEREEIEFLQIDELKKWNPRSVKDILANPFYTGSRIWNRKDNLNKKIRPYEEWVYVSDAHDGLISLETFKKIEGII